MVHRRRISRLVPRPASRHAEGPAGDQDPTRRARRATEEANAYLEARRRRLREQRTGVR